MTATIITPLAVPIIGIGFIIKGLHELVVLDNNDGTLKIFIGIALVVGYFWFLSSL